MILKRWPQKKEHSKCGSQLRAMDEGIRVKFLSGNKEIVIWNNAEPEHQIITKNE